MVSDDLVNKFCETIGHVEGFFASGDKPNLPQRCHNPGNMTDAGDIGFGTARSVGIGAADITIYASDDDGWIALKKKIRHALNGASKVYTLDMTIERFGLEYSRDPNWGRNFASRFGDITPETTLLELVQADQRMQEQWAANGPKP
ncbi:MAG TPA: hypothetical protein VKT80_08470 [Chloroflexota bacterium]|nr:hypothetical protein [Chloroflexota bacterium]